jgi:hypothetical protein
MKKLFLIIAILSLTTFVDAQLWRGYGKGYGVGVDHWFDTELKSDFQQLNLSGLISTFSENTLICPFVSFGFCDNGKTFYKRKEVDNHTYLWEFGTSLLFQVSDHWHIGGRVGYMYYYNRYKSFKDQKRINAGLEFQYNFNSNYRSISNNAIYFNINYKSVGIGYRYYFY